MQSFLRCNNKLHNSIRTFLVGCEKSRVDVVEVFLFWVFACVFWLTPFTLTVLCVSTRVTGLLDFHMVAELV